MSSEISELITTFRNPILGKYYFSTVLLRIKAEYTPEQVIKIMTMSIQHVWHQTPLPEQVKNAMLELHVWAIIEIAKVNEPRRLNKYFKLVPNKLLIKVLIEASEETKKTEPSISNLFQTIQSAISVKTIPNPNNSKA